MTKPSRISEKLALFERRAALSKSKTSELEAEAKQIREEVEKTEPKLQMPLFPGSASAMPTSLVKTSLFANIQRGRRKVMNEAPLAVRGDYQILYTGAQLDIPDSDVFLHCVRLAQNRTAGESIHFERSAFLTAIGRKLGKSSYMHLERSMRRLAGATIYAVGEKRGQTARLLKDLSWDDGEYWFQLDPKVMDFFTELNIAYIDFDSRLKLKCDLAKFLQLYLSGHKAGQKHNIKAADLHRLSGSEGRLRDFIKRALPQALHELEREGILIQTNISPSDIVSWFRVSVKKI